MMQATQPPPEPPVPTGADLKTQILAIIVGIIITVIGTLAYDRVKKFLRNRISVKGIRKSSDKDVQGFVDLYDELIAEHTRIDPAEIVRWVDEDRALRKVKSTSYFHYLFVGKLEGRVVAFLKAMYCSQCTYAFLAYYGIDGKVDQARTLAAPALTKHLEKLIKKEFKGCSAVVFEAEAPSPKLDEKENSKRKARIRLFKDTARRLNYNAYEIGMDYLQPQMEVAPDGKFSEESMVLLYVPIGDPIPVARQLTKKKVLELLRFLYLRIYRPTFRHQPEKDLAYQVYLNSLLKLYEVDLPDIVCLRD